MSNLREVLARFRGEPVADKEKSQAFVGLVKGIYNHQKMQVLQEKTDSRERWCKLTGINWKKFGRVIPMFKLPHLMSLELGCDVSDTSQSVALKLQLNFKEQQEFSILPIPARIIYELKVDDVGKQSSCFKVWNLWVRDRDPDLEDEGMSDLNGFLSLAKRVRDALNGKLGGKIMPVNFAEPAK
ncbi:MAG: hypothetical protein ABH816_03765 [Candidatus Levyibacteriota bacterium]